MAVELSALGSDATFFFRGKNFFTFVSRSILISAFTKFYMLPDLAMERWTQIETVIFLT